MYGDYSSGASGAAGTGVGIAFLLCWGLLLLIGLAMFAFNIWMLIDSIGRQEYEYPNSTGNSKNLWVIMLAVGIVLGVGWLVALFYYFMVFKKLKRGSVAPQWAQQPGAPQQYAPPPAPGYAPPAPPAYQPPPAPPAPPEAYMPPPAPPAPMEPPAQPEPPAEPPAAPSGE